MWLDDNECPSTEEHFNLHLCLLYRIRSLTKSLDYRDLESLAFYRGGEESKKREVEDLDAICNCLRCQWESRTKSAKKKRLGFGTLWDKCLPTAKRKYLGILTSNNNCLSFQSIFKEYLYLYLVSTMRYISLSLTNQQAILYITVLIWL